MKAKSKKHRCHRGDIDWDPPNSWKDSVSADGGFAWFGGCRVCGRRLYQIYDRIRSLRDVETDIDLEEVSERWPTLGSARS